MNEIIETIWPFVLTYGPRVVMALLTLIIGFWVINWFVGTVKKVMVKRNVDESLIPFLKSLLNALLKVMLLISVAGMVGIETTSFIAVIGAAGLAIGLALQGSLSNFAGGVLILILKPFQKGDFITSGSHSGTVNSIQIFYTILKTADNKTIVLPNGPLANTAIINVTAEPTRRLDMVFGIGYGDDVLKAKAVLARLVEEDERIFKDPKPGIFVEALADSSVNFKLKLWLKKEDYWGAFYDWQEKVKLTFDKEGISIPFPQREVHIFNEKS